MTAPSTPLDAPLHGDLLIQASAGTGKTYALTTVVARLLVETEHSIDRLAVVTFTNAATSELRDRIRRTLRAASQHLAGRNDADASEQAADLVAHWRSAGIDDEVAARRLEAAVRDFDRAHVTTIHGFCQRVLGEFAFDGDMPFGFEVGGDAGAQVADAVRDVWRRHMVDAPEELVRHARSVGLNLENFANWVNGLHAQSDLSIRGAEKPLAEARAAVRSGLRERRAAFDALRERWREDCATFRTALESPAPPWRKVSLRKMRDLADDVEAAFERDEPDLLTAEHLGYFSTEKMDSLLLKGRSLPCAALFACFDGMAVAAANHAAAGDEWLRALRRQALEEVREALHRRVWEDRQLSFDALLTELDRALDGAGGEALARRIRDHYPFALIDEFQDTDRIQARIFERIYAAGNADDPPDAARQPCGFIVVGDPKQSIYRFRGADIFAYLNASRRTPDERRLTLTRNYRSTPALVRAVNALFGGEQAFRLDAIEYDEVHPARDDENPLRVDGEDAPPMQLRLCGGLNGRPWTKGAFTDIAAARAAQDIAGLLRLALSGKASIADEPLTGADIAVLVRTRAQGRAVAEQLRRRDVRSIEIGDASVFATDEADQLHRLLHALAAAPGEFDAAQRLRGALSADLFGLDMQHLAALKDDDEVWTSWERRFRDWRARWGRSGVATLIRHLLFAEPVQGSQCLLRYHDGPRRLTNVLHLSELLQQAETNERLAPAGVAEWLARQRADPSVGGESALLRLDSDDQLVRIVTVHGSKGLEFPIVFYPFAWDGRQPRERSKTAEYHEHGEGYPAVLDLAPDDDAHDRQRLEEQSEELRLLYVALTRAQYRCVVTWAFVNRLEYAPLAWLLHGGSKPASEADWLGEVRGFAKTYAGDIETRLFEPDVEECASAARQLAGGAPALAARRLGRELARVRQMTSYSGLVADAGAAVSAEEHRDVELPDHDQRAERAAEADRLATGEAPDGQDAPTVARTPFGFPRGRRPGNCLHAIFESAAKTAGIPLRETILENLDQARIPRHWADVVADMVENARSAPLSAADGATLCLADSESAVAEMEFHLPAGGLRRHRLGECLAVHGYRNPFGEGTQRINGFLHGYIDLVVRHAERWYVVDYKSNWLGDRAGDYSPAAIAAAMHRHDYPLQYLLYVTALHRHLRLRLADYDYDRHMGGAFYLFVRAMSPSHPGRGVHFDRPTRACIEAIDACLDGAGGATRDA